MARRAVKLEDDAPAEDVEMSGNEESDGGDEEVYIVEKIVSHSTERGGQNKYLIKWEGYPDSENTWEAEDNIIDKGMLKKYWNEKNAEKNARASAKKANGRASVVAGSPTAKRMRTDAETSPSDAPEDEDWEPLVDEINTIDRAQDGSLVVYICWKNGKSTEHPAEVAYKRCPQKMLQFYEGRLRFRPK